MSALQAIEIGLTEHLEGELDKPSANVFRDAEVLVTLADQLGVRYAWFAEHHGHAHRGHLPTPLLLALHLAARTTQIALGTAVICLNHHRAPDVAEQVAVADVLSAGRMAIGFGSGSTPAEAALFDVAEMSERQRHEHFARALQKIRDWWSDRPSTMPRLPRPRADLFARCWCAVNSVGPAKIAGASNLNVLFSHLRTPLQYAEYTTAYRDAGGRALIAANRPLIVAATDDAAFEVGEVAIRPLWRRFQAEGKIARDLAEPASLADVCAHPLNFIVGSPASVAEQIARLHAQCPFDVLNVEVTWPGLSSTAAQNSLRLLVAEVMPRLQRHPSRDHSEASR